MTGWREISGCHAGRSCAFLFPKREPMTKTTRKTARKPNWFAITVTIIIVGIIAGVTIEP